MSAHLCGIPHILYLVAAARRLSPPHQGFHWSWNDVVHDLADPGTPLRIARLLLAENTRSVGWRYAGEPLEILPGPEEKHPITERDLRTAWAEIDPVQVLKSCDCYTYQSCEHPGWAASEARAFVQNLKNTAISALPGYEQAVWGAPEPMTPRRKADARRLAERTRR